jgi:cellobiose-specific phosphotransferase system component IIC
LSFVALLIAFVATIPFVSVPGPFFSSSLGLRVAGALLPAFSAMGFALAPALAVRYAQRSETPAFPAVMACLLAYLVALPPFSGTLLDYAREVGPSGLFLALAIGLLYAIVMQFGKRAWVAAGIVLACALAVRLAHISLTGYIEAGLHPLATLGDTYVALLAIVVIEMLLWSIGVHGPAMLAAVVTPVYLTMQLQNSAAYTSHQPLPHIVVVSLFLFVFPGGAGATFPLAVFCAFSRIPKLRTIGRAAALPALLNINEPLLFGAPVVFNPYLIPPFIVVPIVLATTTYFAVLWNWVARPAFYVPSSVPSVIATFIATVDWRAIVLVLVNIAISAAVYFPFVKAYERHLDAA